MNKLFYGSNAKGRRKLRRQLLKQGKTVPAKLIALKTEVLKVKLDAVQIESMPIAVDPNEHLMLACPIGASVRITTDDYGKSYKGEKATVTGYENGMVIVQVRPSKRKSPLACNAEHLTLS